jgi:hypothetical protein
MVLPSIPHHRRKTPLRRPHRSGRAARGTRKFWMPPDLDEVEKLASHGLTFDQIAA